MTEKPQRKRLRTSPRAQTMAKRLTDARNAMGLKVDQIYYWLIEQRMAAKSPKKSPLWIGTVRKWFHYGLEEVPNNLREDFERLCQLLKIPSIDDLWVDPK